MSVCPDLGQQAESILLYLGTLRQLSLFDVNVQAHGGCALLN